MKLRTAIRWTVDGVTLYVFVHVVDDWWSIYQDKRTRDRNRAQRLADESSTSEEE